jgi:acetolactate synthase I/II/III large subunit
MADNQGTDNGGHYRDITARRLNQKALNPGQQVAKVLKQEGLDLVFTLCGGHIVTVHEGCVEEGIGVIDVRHEQAAVHAAEGYAIATGRPGAAVLTAGPGVTNGMTGVASAFMSGTPIMVIGGRSPLGLFDKVALQDIDQSSMMRPICKWARTVHQARRAGEYVAAGLREMLDGRPGPVFIDIPLDLISEDVPIEQVAPFENYRTAARSCADPRDIERAVELLRGAERPVVLASSGVHWSGAHAELQRFIEHSRIPLFTINQARGGVPDDHELAFGPMPFLGLRDADVLLAIGVTFDYRLDFGVFERGLRVIHIDDDRRRIGLNRPIDLGIVADPKLALSQLTDAFSSRSRTLPWVEVLRARCRDRMRELDALAMVDSKYMHALRVAKEVDEFVARDASVIIDGGDIAMYSGLRIQSYLPGHTISTLGPLGNIGGGIPFALAVQALRPGKQVVAIVGDGSFGLNAMEFDTAVRHNLPFVCVIANDGGWGNIRWPWKKRRKDGFSVGVELGFRRYERMVEAMGGHAEFVEHPGDLKPALQRAFSSGRPACINVLTDPAPTSSPYEFMSDGWRARTTRRP